MNEIQIAFEVALATVHQIVVITDKQYTEELIVEGLNNGTIVTTTWHEQGRDVDNDTELTLERVADGHIIGFVKSQEVDGEYINFR